MACNSSLLRLPPEALQRCLLSLRATELALHLGACCSSLRRACQCPEFWKLEAERLFPQAVPQQPPRSWRAFLANSLRAQYKEERDRHLVHKCRLRSQAQESEARRVPMLMERQGMAQHLEALRAKHKEARRQAAQADSWRTPRVEVGATNLSSVAGHGAKRAAVKELFEAAFELQEVIEKKEAELKKLDKEISEMQRRENRLHAMMRNHEGPLRLAESRLTRLPKEQKAETALSSSAAASSRPPSTSRSEPAAASAAGPSRAAAGACRPASRAAAMAAAAGERAAAAAARTRERAAARAAARTSGKQEPAAKRFRYEDLRAAS
mmetsp:Transcript_13770/g.22663  ORF Transcript_13770/g.22663 Transcript_13770/m.22663 type:complete len:324 (-) Transcript_13770:7-978(-)